MQSLPRFATSEKEYITIGVIKSCRKHPAKVSIPIAKKNNILVLEVSHILNDVTRK